MNKILRYLLVALLAMVMGNVYAEEVTLDFDNDYATLFPTLKGVSSGSNENYVSDGDFTGATTSTAINGVTVTVTPAEDAKTPSRIWSGAPRLRMYSGTFKVSGKGITKIEFTGHNTNFNLSTETGTLEGKVWSGEADEVLFAVAKNTQINKIVVTIAAGGGGSQEGVSVGIARPTFTAADGTVTYDTWQYIGSVDKFNKSVDGLTAKFFQSAEIEATIVKDETQEGGYEIKSVCHQGEKNISCDYVWKLNCADYDGSLKRHKTETLGSEKWQFGFDLTVAEGKTFSVSAIDFDLLVEQNPSYCIRIMKGETEVYNSTWITKTGGYNNKEWGAGSYCRITKDDVSFLFEEQKDGNAINYQAIQYYPGFEEGVGVLTPLGDLKLAAGTYRIVADVDFNKDSSKAMSFDNFTLEGTIADGGSSTEGGVIFSWEGAEAGATVTGGTATYMSGPEGTDRVNYKNADYYTLSINGKKANMGTEASNNGGYIQIDLNQELAADDAIEMTGYINKNEAGKEASIFFQFEKGEGVDDPYIYGDADNIDPTVGGKISTHELKVPADAAGSKNFKMSRNKAGTNVFLTKLVITRGGASGISDVKVVRVADGAIYNLAGQKVGKDYKGIVIMNGKKVVQK